MTKEDHRFIIELLFYHGFSIEKIHHSTQLQLYSVMNEFIDMDYDNLELNIDWKPIYNTLYAITMKKKLNTILLSITDNEGNIYNKLESLCYKLK